MRSAIEPEAGRAAMVPCGGGGVAFEGAGGGEDLAGVPCDAEGAPGLLEFPPLDDPAGWGVVGTWIGAAPTAYSSSPVEISRYPFGAPTMAATGAGRGRSGTDGTGELPKTRTPPPAVTRLYPGAVREAISPTIGRASRLPAADPKKGL